MALLVKQGTFLQPTTSGSHTQVVDGIGFQPKAIILHTLGEPSAAMDQWRSNSYTSLGFATGPEDQVSTHLWGSTGNIAWYKRYSTTQVLAQYSTGASEQRNATLVSLNSDGFTLDWFLTRNYNNNAIVGYLALGGDDLINAKAFEAGRATAAGSYIVGDVGFEPNTVMFSIGNPRTTQGIQYNFGVATPSGQWTQSAGSNASSSSGATSWLRHGKAINTQLSNGSTLNGVAELATFDPNGFTLSFDNAMPSDVRMLCLALEMKEPAIVGSIEQPATLGVNYNALGSATPKGMLFSTRSKPQSTGISSDATFGIGMTDGSSGYATATKRLAIATTVGTEQSFSPILTREEHNASSAASGKADVTFEAGGFYADWVITDGVPREVAYLAFMQALPIVEASSGLSSSSELAVQVNGSYGTSTSTSSTSIMSSVLQATRNDSLTVVADSSLHIDPSAAYGITTTCTFSSDMTAMTSKATDTESLFESYTDIVPEVTRIQFGEMSEDTNSTLTLALQRARFDQWSVSSHSDLNVYPILLIDGTVRLSALSDIEVLPNVMFSSDAFIQTESGIYVRLSPRLMKTYEKVFAQPQIRLAIAKQIGLPHGEFQ